MPASAISLSSGTSMPPLALGLWQVSRKEECILAIHAALKVGYRHFDSAQYYGNEGYLGEAVRTGGVPRSELFLTTKISNENQAQGELEPSFDASLKKLGSDYWDLLLLHFPVSRVRHGNWKRMEALHASGRARAIGVSNYTVRHLEELLAQAKVKPVVNQVELHVFLQQPALLKFCKAQGILVQAYSPIARGSGHDHATLKAIGAKHKKTPAQVMIRWCIDSGAVPLPKSVTPERIRQNFEVFDFALDSDDMTQLAKLDRNERICWDPTDVA